MEHFLVPERETFYYLIKTECWIFLVFVLVDRRKGEFFRSGHRVELIRIIGLDNRSKGFRFLLVFPGYLRAINFIVELESSLFVKYRNK